MKKIILLSFSLLAFAVSFAQIKNDKGTFTKPDAGEYVFETQMRFDVTGAGALFSLNDGFLANLSAGMNPEILGAPSKAYFPMLKVRKFTSKNSAQRFGLNLSYASTSVKGNNSSDKNSDFGLALSYGMEKHFSGAERLSTYVGADATVGFNSISNKSTAGSTTDKTSQFGFGFGVKAFTGMDYYFIPKVYLGIELGYGLGINSYGKVKFQTGDNGTTNSEFTFTPFVSPTFRLGYRF